MWLNKTLDNSKCASQYRSNFKLKTTQSVPVSIAVICRKIRCLHYRRKIYQILKSWRRLHRPHKIRFCPFNDLSKPASNPSACLIIYEMVDTWDTFIKSLNSVLWMARLLTLKYTPGRTKTPRKLINFTPWHIYIAISQPIKRSCTCTNS